MIEGVSGVLIQLLLHYKRCPYTVLCSACCLHRWCNEPKRTQVEHCSFINYWIWWWMNDSRWAKKFNDAASQSVPMETKGCIKLGSPADIPVNICHYDAYPLTLVLHRWCRKLYCCHSLEAYNTHCGPQQIQSVHLIGSVVQLNSTHYCSRQSQGKATSSADWRDSYTLPKEVNRNPNSYILYSTMQKFLF